jgi:RNA polymerase-binding transcription factor DksA
MKKISKNLLFQLKKGLEKEKKELEEELKTFAKKDEKLEHDWDTRFPHFDGESGGGILEKAADEVEEYSTLLPIEYSLELKLREVNLALERMKKGKYGICQKCQKVIEIERLKFSPEVKLCSKCLKKI